MRLQKILLPRPSCDPKTLSGSYTAFEPKVGGAVFDLYFVGGVFYVCRDGHVGIYGSHGTGIVAPEQGGTKIAAELMQKYPRPKGYAGLVETEREQPANA